MPRITDATSLAQINKAISRIDDLFIKVGQIQKSIQAVKHQVSQVAVHHAPATTNNVTFHWDGPSATLSWAAGSVKDKKAVNVPVTAGSITGLTPSTYYWLSWNRTHQAMSAHNSADVLFNIPDNLVICQVFTGTGGNVGVAGGGGSSGAHDLSGSRYKLF